MPAISQFPILPTASIEATGEIDKVAKRGVVVQVAGHEGPTALSGVGKQKRINRKH